ncbi:hypothetical protein TAMA11512_13450 [Selenomonas sp. TAMA-11512]|uniref:hypothetical protein n=1 Tax=Selenomonas sp. TAMA-11512 TaxID=3095337 RepID=UPI003090B42D|nr:hypothetical protein TAMA11512_13450 [Selenomonas sp. TAMA-11512]
MNINYRLYLCAFCMLLSLCCFHARDCLASDPPAEYVIWDYMPSASVVEAKLAATAHIDLYNAPRGNTIVSSISTGEIVQRTSCAVYTHPQKHPVHILKTRQLYQRNSRSRTPDGPTLELGDYVYLLMHIGEGVYIGWYNDEEVWGLGAYGIKSFWNRYSQEPWGEYVGEQTSENLSIEVWYRLRKSDGTTGWAMVAKNGDFSYEHLKRVQK